MNNDLNSVSSHANRRSVIRKAKVSPMIAKEDEGPQGLKAGEERGEQRRAPAASNTLRVGGGSLALGQMYGQTAGPEKQGGHSKQRPSSGRHEQISVIISTQDGHQGEENHGATDSGKREVSSLVASKRSNSLVGRVALLDKVAKDALNERQSEKRESPADGGLPAKPGAGVRLKSTGTGDGRESEGPHLDRRSAQKDPVLALTKKLHIKSGPLEEQPDRAGVQLPTINRDMGPRRGGEFDIKQRSDRNEGHNVFRPSVLGKSKSQQRVDRMAGERPLHSSAMASSLHGPMFQYNRGRIPSLRASIVKEQFKEQGLEHSHESLKALLGPKLPLAKTTERNDMILLSARLQQAKQTQLSRFGHRGGSLAKAGAALDQVPNAHSTIEHGPKQEDLEDLIDASLSLSFKATIPGQKQQKMQFLDKIARKQQSVRPNRNASQLVKAPPYEDDAKFGVKRSVLEFKEKEAMTKRFKQGKHKRLIVGIEGACQPASRSMSKASDELHRHDSGHNRRVTQQLFEAEVRIQLKQHLKIFSKETQNIIKRGIEYVEPLRRAAGVDTNSYRKEQLRSEYIKYLSMVIIDRHGEEDAQSPLNLGESRISIGNQSPGASRTLQPDRQLEETLAMNENEKKARAAAFGLEEAAPVLSAKIRRTIQEFVISLKHMFEGSESSTGLLQEFYVIFDQYWGLLQDLTKQNGKNGAVLALNVEKHRQELPEGPKYFSSEAYMAQVHRRFGMLDVQKLFTRSGFIEAFMSEYWSVQERVLANLKQKIQRNEEIKQELALAGGDTDDADSEIIQYTILVISQSFYLLRSILALRLDSLFKFEDNKHNREMETQRQNHEQVLSEHQRQMAELKSQSAKQRQEMQQRIEELQEQLNNAKLERDYMKKDLQSSRSFAQKLKEQLTYFTHDQQLNDILVTNYDSDNVDELTQKNKEAVQREQRKFGEEVVQDLLVRLESYIKEIDACKVTSVDIAQRMNRMVDRALGEHKDGGQILADPPESVFNQFLPAREDAAGELAASKVSGRGVPVVQPAAEASRSPRLPAQRKIGQRHVGTQVDLTSAASKEQKKLPNAAKPQQSGIAMLSTPARIEFGSSRKGIEEEADEEAGQESDLGGTASAKRINLDVPGLRSSSSIPLLGTNRNVPSEASKAKKFDLSKKSSSKGRESPVVDSVLESLKPRGADGLPKQKVQSKMKNSIKFKKKPFTSTKEGEAAEKNSNEAKLLQDKSSLSSEKLEKDLDKARKGPSPAKKQGRNSPSVQASSVKGWKGGDGSPGRRSSASFQAARAGEADDSYDDEDDEGAYSEQRDSDGVQVGEAEEEANLDILMRNKQLKSMIGGGQSKLPAVNDKTENLKMVLKSESAGAKIMMQMTRQKLFSIFDDLLNKRLWTIFQISNAYKGMDGGNLASMKANAARAGETKLQATSPSEPAAKEIQQLTLVEFIFNHYLREYERKSMAIKQINSIVIGLIKYFEKNKEENFYLFFLLRLLDFDETVWAYAGQDPNKMPTQTGWKAPQHLSAKQQNQDLLKKKLEEMKGEPNIWDRWANQKAAINSEGVTTDYSRFTYEQQAIVLWSRRVFTYAQEKFLLESQTKIRQLQKKAAQSIKRYSDPDFAQNIELEFKAFNGMFHEKNGGVLGLNYAFKMLHRALFGEDMAPIADQQKLKNAFNHQVGLADLGEEQALQQLRSDGVTSKPRTNISGALKDKDFVDTHQLFVEMIINLQVEDLFLYDMHSATAKERPRRPRPGQPDVLPYRGFEEYDENYKLFSEAKFLLWKMLALIKYSHINLAEFPISKTQASLLGSSLRDMSSEKRGPTAAPSDSQQANASAHKAKKAKKGAKLQSPSSEKPDSDEDLQDGADRAQDTYKLFDVDYKNKCIDLSFLIEYLEKKYLSKYKKKQVSKGVEAQEAGLKAAQGQNADYLAGAMKQKTKIFKQSQLEVLKNFLGHLGLKDIRMVQVTQIEQLVAQHVEEQNLLFPNFSKNLSVAANQKLFAATFDQTRELHLVSYTQFCKICLSQWKLTVQTQIQSLHRIFYESDENQDGVLTLQEFWGLLISLEADNTKRPHVQSRAVSGLQSNAASTPSGQDHTPSSRKGPADLEQKQLSAEPKVSAVTPHQDQHRAASPRIGKERAIQLFNEALDFSNVDMKEERVKEIHRQMEIEEARGGQNVRNQKRRTPPEESQHPAQDANGNSIGVMDKITAPGFTRMVMKNQVGGFAIGKVFSDLRYTLHL